MLLIRFCSAAAGPAEMDLGILHSDHLCGCMLSGLFLHGEIRSVTLHVALLRMYANDTRKHGSLVFCCPGVVALLVQPP